VCEPIDSLIPRLALCGDSARDVASFTPQGQLLLATETCAPGQNTQAMLVTVSGLAQLQQPTLLGYLNDGGIVITSAGASFEIYNRIFGTSFTPDTPASGNCDGNINPEVPLNTNDPFWLANPYSPQGVGGCGNDLTTLPGIVPLGSRSSAGDTLSLAYVQVGDGRVWFVESDWPFGTTAISPQSVRLMRHMVQAK
jgi:hypothetical protein